MGDGWKGREEVGTLIFPHAVLLEKHFKQAGVTETSQEECINEIRKGHLAIQHTQGIGRRVTFKSLNRSCSGKLELGVGEARGRGGKVNSISFCGWLLKRTVALVENCIRLHGLGSEREVVETYFFDYTFKEFAVNGRKIGPCWPLTVSFS